MPQGKPAGVICVQLDEVMGCRLFGDPRRPDLCAAFTPEASVCGDTREQALQRLTLLEIQTLPGARSDTQYDGRR